MANSRALAVMIVGLSVTGLFSALPSRGAPPPNPANPAPVELDIQATGPDQATHDLLLSIARDRLSGGADRTPPESRVLSIEFNQETKGAEPEFRILSFNYVTQAYHEFRGSLSDPSRMEEHPAELLSPPGPTPEEFNAAADLVRKDPVLGQGEWDPYIAMPGTDPEEPSRRVLTIGLRPREGSDFQHEIVGVDLGSGRIKRYPNGAPSGSIATRRLCAPPDAGQWITGQGWAGQTKVEVKQGGEKLWSLTAIRPSASSGYRGSGIELREIYYRGKRIAGVIHVPILNVRYVGDVCGPYRDWTYSESAFRAHGEPMAQGFIRASTKPTTIFETGDDAGNFRGVAVYRDGDETVLVSEMEAGWYRYKSEYRLGDDGTIHPIWGFAGVQSSCTCHTHLHHAYFRMDLDMSDGNGAHDIVQYFDGSQWVTVSKEGRFRRDEAHRRWRVLDPATGRGMEIIPGPHDGTADDYGRGDIWALVQHPREIDDSAINRSTRIGIDPFINGEDLRSTDVVLWYGVHFRHITDNISIQDNAELGPTLRPIQAN